MESPVPPPLVVTVAAPQSHPSFRLLDEQEIGATASAEVSNRSNPTAAVVQVVPTPSEPPVTPTPKPTFTPPALPKTPPWEHYWLRRPIPEGGTVWTDKAYPYGSTRSGTLRTHHGVEFNVAAGTPALAAASGTVLIAGTDQDEELGPTSSFYGNVIVIELDAKLEEQRVFILHGHLSEIRVNAGQHVQAQEVIALSGATGVADGAHLHFEVRVGENSYDATRNPLLWLYPFPDRGVVAGRIISPSGLPIDNLMVSIRRIDAPSPYSATTSYADSSVNSDDNWNENFALDDLYAGYYELTVGSGEHKVNQELWVYPYQTSFIEITYGS